MKKLSIICVLFFLLFSIGFSQEQNSLEIDAEGNVEVVNDLIVTKTISAGS